MKACINASKSLSCPPSIARRRTNAPLQNGCPCSCTYLALETPEKIPGQHIKQRRKGKRRLHCSAQPDGQSPHATDQDPPRQWGITTERLVGVSSIPFALLVLPQTYSSYLFGNSLMFTHFAGKNELTATGIQVLGVFSNLLVLCQVAYANCMPMPAFWCIVALSLVTSAINFAKLLRLMPARPIGEGWGIWRCWQAVTGLAGFAALPQVLWITFMSPSAGILPGLLALLLAALWLLIQVRTKAPKQLEGIIDNLPGWGATVIFALSPLPQLVRNFVSSHHLEGISVGTILLSLLGNSLMVPRALLIQDRVWLLGAMWACVVGGWLQLLSLYMGTSPSTGARFLEAPILVAVTLLLSGYLGLVTHRDAAAKGHVSPLKSWTDALGGHASLTAKAA